MIIEETHLQSPSGPAAYDNWLAAKNDKPWFQICEYPLFTDARVSGEITEGFGPYQFINLVPIISRPGLVKAAIILRVKFHVKYPFREFNKTDTERYHGGLLNDEIAALSSLALGIRLKAGGAIRIFEPNGDPMGRPTAWDMRPDPAVIIRGYGLLLPSAVGPHSLELLKPLSLFPILIPSDAIALVRAARLYQDALWISESEPSLSWIMLVSSIEAAANHWRATND